MPSSMRCTGASVMPKAQFYIGEWQLLRANRPAAIESLRTSANTCPKDFVEATDAQAELKRLGQ
jgi:hypothetical protein